jgi:hypothetical protein
VNVKGRSDLRVDLLPRLAVEAIADLDDGSQVTIERHDHHALGDPLQRPARLRANTTPGRAQDGSVMGRKPHRSRCRGRHPFLAANRLLLRDPLSFRFFDFIVIAHRSSHH